MQRGWEERNERSESGEEGKVTREHVSLWVTIVFWKI